MKSFLHSADTQTWLSLAAATPALSGFVLAWVNRRRYLKVLVAGSLWSAVWGLFILHHARLDLEKPILVITFIPVLSGVVGLMVWLSFVVAGSDE